MKRSAKWRQFRLTTAFVVTGLMIGTVLLSSTSEVAARSTVPTSYGASSGYEVASTVAPLTSARASLTVPSVNPCPNTEEVDVEVLFSTNSGPSGVGVQLACDQGFSSYLPHVTSDGSRENIPTTVTIGDALTLSVSMTPTQSSFTFIDNTTGFSYTQLGPGAVATAASIGTTAILKDPLVSPVAYSIPKSSPVSFSGVQVNGRNLSTYTSSTGLLEDIETTNGDGPPSGTIQVMPSALRKSSSFSLMWKHR